MAEIVNLNRTRKALARDKARRDAEANAVKFGRTKAERQREATEAEKRTRALDGHAREDRKPAD